MLRRTKIVATLGPATHSEQALEELIRVGVNVVRMNFSHGCLAEHQERAAMIRRISARLNQSIAILGDLQGPKIRVSRFVQGKVTLKKGQAFILDAALGDNLGDESRVGIDYKALPADVSPDDSLLLDDGRIVLKVSKVQASEIHCSVEIGGILSNNKGINRKGGGVSAKALTDKDRQDIRYAADIGVDYLAVSFPSNAEDIIEARALLKQAGSEAKVIAKIERAESVASVEVLDNLIKASDAVMVARGDLGVEIGDAELIGVQKHIIQRARKLNRAVITATQMMESMIHNPMPTRAEVFDVANAVLDGTDAVMLSAETATGDYPYDVVKSMARVCLGAEKHMASLHGHQKLESVFGRVDEAIAMATMATANHLHGVKAIICLTESGSTPLWMSRIPSALPIYALARHEQIRRQMSLYSGVYAIPYDITTKARADVNSSVVYELKSRGLVEDGDLVIITKGDQMGVHGGTNAMKVLEVGTTF